MPAKPVLGKLPAEVGHHPVPGHLGHHRRRGDGAAGGISVHDHQLGHRHISGVTPVDEHQLWPDRQSQNGPPVGEAHRLQDVQPVDLLHGCHSDLARDRTGGDLLIEHVPLGGSQPLGIVEVRKRDAGRQDHRGGHHRSRQGRHADLIHSGDRRESLRPLLAFNREESVQPRRLAGRSSLYRPQPRREVANAAARIARQDAHEPGIDGREPGQPSGELGDGQAAKHRRAKRGRRITDRLRHVSGVHFGWDRGNPADSPEHRGDNPLTLPLSPRERGIGNYLVHESGALRGPVDHQRLADDVFVWDEAEEAAVLAVAAIVAEHEELA